MKRKLGGFRHELAFQSLTRTGDGQGGSTQSWATTATVWGHVEPRSSTQIAFSDELQKRVTHRITIRDGEVSGLSAEMRISWDNRIFHIRGFRDLEERSRFIEIDAEEGAAS